MRYSICRIDEGYAVEDIRSGDRMSYHKSYEAALKSLTKLRRSIVLRDEIVVEIWSTCREPVILTGCSPAATIVIKNGIYSFKGKALDGVEGGDSGTLVLRDGTIRGGTSFFYIIGTYSCSDGRWKGEMTIEEHTQAPATRPMARRIVSIGFSGTYTDMAAEATATALIGKQSVRYDAIFRLLLAD